VTYPSLEHVAIDARPYPTGVLEGCETALVLFAAAFLGRNDAVHFADAGVPFVTLVDVDGERLEEMRGLYRDPDWHWVVGDAWYFARKARDLEARFDVVSLDPFTGTAMTRVHADLEPWTAIAKRAVVLGVLDGDVLNVPGGWHPTELIERGNNVLWAVLEPYVVVE
jgi:hypothetical protein